LRTNLVEEDPAKLWSHYLLLVAVEEAFKNLKGDLAIRPVFHQLEARVEAHVFIAFLAYCLQRVGEVCRRADDRRAPADHRRPRAAAQPLDRARDRAHPVAGKIQTGAARPTTPQNHRRARAAEPAVVPTFGGRLQ
jgi:Na+-transporting methylmalonyl-CoA/oxaloacetate decarboxylase gamma subunit